MNFHQMRIDLKTRFATLLNDSDLEIDRYTFDLFHFQYKYNEIYRKYCNNLKINTNNIYSIDQIPLLPISAFKHYDVKTGDFDAEQTFESSGTTDQKLKSKHLISDISWYHNSATRIWESYYGKVSEYCFLALLPGYLERKGSSLVSMVDHFISKSKYKQSGFYLREHAQLFDALHSVKLEGIPTVVIGVTYGLLDFIEKYQIDFPELILIETGGMKGQRQEKSKAEIHKILRSSFGIEEVHSEYGMTELLSQAYSKDQGKFTPNALLRPIIKQISDPLSNEKPGKSGILTLIDLANLDSCAFIQTEDMAIIHPNGQFELMGRLENSDIRGCNLMVEDVE